MQVSGGVTAASEHDFVFIEASSPVPHLGDTAVMLWLCDTWER